MPFKILNENNTLKKETYNRNIFRLIILLTSVFLGYQINNIGISITYILIGSITSLIYITLSFKNPLISFISFIIYAFIGIGLARITPTVPIGLLMDVLLVITLLSIFFNKKNNLKINELITFSILWFLINVIQLLNPYQGSITGWFFGMRSAALYWVLITPIVFNIFNKKNHLTIFINTIITISVLGSLYGIKQHFLGVSSFEQAWLDFGNDKTHILFGVLRVFSFYSDAGQFGASQAHLGLVSLILAFTPNLKNKQKLLYFSASLIQLYGFLISGTRGALFVLLSGGLTYLLLSKKTKILISGIIIGSLAFCFLKFTFIGQSNSEIRRLRTSIDFNDASFQERLRNQNILKEYLKSRPFGTGVGTIGNWGVTYNPNKYLSQIPPDSLFVKNWAEYGIIGFIIWISIQLYLLGKGGGIIWKLQDKHLKQKILALTAGSAGILVASYGNEVQNQMPSAMIIYITWALTYMAPKWDSKSKKTPN